MTSDIAVDARCPACSERTLRLATVEHEVPYFGACMESVLRCSTCHFRHTDFMILSQKDPVRHAYAIANTDDMSVRVVRSNSGTIRVPEVGFTAEPTARSEAFVSNIQGVLDRVRDVLLTARTIYADEPESVRVAEERLAMVAEIEAGDRRATLIIDDPLGNSAILSEQTDIRALTPEEVEQLETGMVIIDKDDLAGDG